MFLKGIYAGKPALFQLFILLFLIVAGAVFSSVLAMCLFLPTHIPYTEVNQHPDMMRLLQLISAIGTFLFPAFTLAWLCSDHPKKFLSMESPIKHDSFANRPYGYTFFSIVLLTPAISLIGLLNQQMELPDFLAPVENWMRAQEAAAEQVTRLLLNGNSMTTLFFNLIVIALTAGITEEFLFRGALQRVIGKWTQNHHIVIWSTAAIFSAFHFQFFGFLPRMLLGAYFGYLLYWSRTIWLPVFAHFVNNALAVIGMSDARLRENEFVTGDISPENLLLYTIVAFIMLVLFYGCAKRIQRQFSAR